MPSSFKSFLLMAVVLLAALAPVSGAEPAKEISQLVQTFYDRYTKADDSQAWLLKSKQVTPEFKKAYAAFMKEPSHDPIIMGQDTPESGFKASPAVIQGNKAIVTMRSSEPGFPQAIKVQLVLKGETWLINGVGELRGKEASSGKLGR